MDPITGIWFSDYMDGNGNHLKSSLPIFNDGTGVCYDVYDNGTVDQVGLTWTATSDGVYAITYTDGQTRVFAMNEAQDTMTSSSGAVIEKMFPLANSAVSIVGPWSNEKTGTVTVFNADGTGSIYKSSSVIGTFVWTNGKEAGTFDVHYDTGGFAGHDAVWSYDGEHDQAFGDDGMFCVVRPTASVDGVTIKD